jgi:hypothetical protein
MYVSYDNDQGILTIRSDIVNFRLLEDKIRLETENGDYIYCNNVSFGVHQPITKRSELFTKENINLMGN